MIMSYLLLNKLIRNIIVLNNCLLNYSNNKVRNLTRTGTHLEVFSV
jgi:hypothetical protein